MMPRVEFWSSVEGAAFQRALLRELGAAGWDVAAHHSVAQADYWAARGGFARMRTRAAAYLNYPLKIAWRSTCAPANSVAVVTSNTFFAPRVSQMFGRRPSVHWVFDLFPDVLIAAGVLRAGGFAERRLHRLMRRTFDEAAANVFLGEWLRRHAESRFGAIPRAHVIAIGAAGDLFRTAPTPRSDRKPRILYCGNLGRMHDVDTLIQAFRRGAAAEAEFVFHGNGVGLRQLADALRLLNPAPHVTVGGNLPDADWLAEMQAAEVALVTLRAGAEGLVMPSKTYSALVAGQAVLAVCREESDLAALVRRHDAGWVVRPGDVEGFCAAVARLAQNPAEVLAKRQNAWRAGHEFYEERALARRWDQLLRDVVMADVSG